MKERIQKVLSEAGVESRRHVEEMILQGRVMVNGRYVTKLPVMIDPEEDTVTIDDQRVNLKRRMGKSRAYIVMNKPKGVYCTNVAQGEQKRAIDLLPPEFEERVYPVGRLDAESRGLLLLTNDGELTQMLTHPKYGLTKTYTATVDGEVKPDTIQKMMEGVWLADPDKGGYKTSKCVIKIVRKTEKGTILQITLRESRNRELRRMLARLGHKVREMTRTKIGPLELGNMKPGQSRLLTPKEVEQLRAAALRRGTTEEPVKPVGDPNSPNKLKRPFKKQPPRKG